MRGYAGEVRSGRLRRAHKRLGRRGGNVWQASHAHTLDTRTLTSLHFVLSPRNPVTKKKGKVGPLDQLLRVPASVFKHCPASRLLAGQGRVLS